MSNKIVLLILICLIFGGAANSETHKINYKFINEKDTRFYLQKKYSELEFAFSDTGLSIECDGRIFAKIQNELNMFDAESLTSYKYYIALGDMNSIVNSIQSQYPEAKVNFDSDKKIIEVEAKGFQLLEIYRLIDSKDLINIKKFQIKYSDINQLTQTIQQIFQINNIAQFEKTKELIVSANPKQIELIGKYIDEIDNKPPTILVEGIIVKVNHEKARQMGANYNYKKGQSDDAASGGKSGISLKNSSFSPLPEGIPYDMIEWTSKSGNVFTLSLGMLVEAGAADILLKPHITFLSGGEGSFSQNINVPHITTSENGTNVDFSSVGLTVNVGGIAVKQKNNKNTGLNEYQIVLNKLEITDGSQGNQIESEGNKQIAFVTNSMQINSPQIINSGEIIALGGAIRREESVTRNYIPVFGSLPLLKYLFAYDNKTLAVNEIMTFLKLTVLEERKLEEEVDKLTKTEKFHKTDINKSLKNMLNSSKLETSIFSSSIIYQKNGGYFEFVNNKFSEKQLEKISKKFVAVIRSRIEDAFLTQNYELVKNVIFNDADLKTEIAKLSKSYKAEPLQIIIIARHTGVINDEIFLIYKDWVKNNF